MSDVLPIILSGGSGTRLWPLSRESYPKQFLPLVGDKSMLQSTWLQPQWLPTHRSWWPMKNTASWLPSSCSSWASSRLPSCWSPKAATPHRRLP